MAAVVALPVQQILNPNLSDHHCGCVLMNGMASQAQSPPLNEMKT